MPVSSSPIFMSSGTTISCFISFRQKQADIVKFMGPKNVATVKHKIMSVMKTAFHLKKNQEFEGMYSKCLKSELQ